jgi:hypothetical protein
MTIEALVSVGGYEFPEPSTYSAITATIVDSGRNVEGKVCGSVVRSDVAKIELTWKFLTVEQWATILSIFNSSFFNEVRFFNQATGSYDVRTMYVSDRDASMFRRDPDSGAVMGWLNPKLSLVEV